MKQDNFIKRLTCLVIIELPAHECCSINWGSNELLIPVLLHFWHSCFPINLWIIHLIVIHEIYKIRIFFCICLIYQTFFYYFVKTFFTHSFIIQRGQKWCVKLEWKCQSINCNFLKIYKSKFNFNLKAQNNY